MQQILTAIAFVALIIGGINWGLQPFGLDLVDKFDQLVTLSLGKWIKWFIGLSALYLIYIIYKQASVKSM